jgi:hypothetical protein
MPFMAWRGNNGAFADVVATAEQHRHSVASVPDRFSSAVVVFLTRVPLPYPPMPVHSPHLMNNLYS